MKFTAGNCEYVDLQQDLFYGLTCSYMSQKDREKENVLQNINILILAWGQSGTGGTSCSSHGS